MARSHRLLLVPLAVAAALATALPAAAEERAPSPEEVAMMQAYQKAATPGPQHARLAAQAGTWDVVIRSWNAPDAPPSEETGFVVRTMMLDGRVLAERMQAKMAGEPFSGLGMTGYDNTTGRYWSTWTDSMSTGIMLSHGDCDENNTCTFTGSWTDPVTKQDVTARMVSHQESADVERFEMFAPGPDGKEAKMMEMTYTRRAQ